MYRYKATIAYDGSVFYGFQKNKNCYTVELELMRVLFIINKTATKVYGSGRTDAGVHALGQVVHFDLSFSVLPRKLMFIMNNLLIPAIRVLKIENVSDTFHARYNAKEKTYKYIVSTKLDPFKQKYRYFYNYKLSLRILKKACKIFVGTRDFLAFTKTTEKNTVRTIFKFKVKRKKDEIIFLVSGDGFLRYQVRFMIGMILYSARGKMSIGELKNVLFSKNNKATSKIVPGCGLYLVKVKY